MDAYQAQPFGGEPGEEEKVLMVNDVARAFFEAPVKRNLCVELPPEEGARPDEVGWLKQSLYGTRDASANFQDEVRVVLTRAGFVQVKYNPSLYYHPKRHIRNLVHGDDFSSVGSSRELKKRMSIKDIILAKEQLI